LEKWLIFTLIVISITLLSLATLIYKAKGLLNWRLSLNREIKDLIKDRDLQPPTRQAAYDIIFTQYHQIVNQPLPKEFSINHFFQFVQSIAACFHPTQPQPLYQISIGHLLEAIEQTLIRFQLILRRPGFGVIAKLRFIHLIRAHKMIDDYRSDKRFRWIRMGWPVLKKLNWLRIVVMGDWISGYVTLLRNYLITRITRYLLADLFLYLGKLALAAYDIDDRNIPADKEKPPGLSDIQQAIDEISNGEIVMDERLLEIRHRLIGFKRLVYYSPGIEDLKMSLVHAAQYIAFRQFPDWEKPLQAATLGAAFNRLTHWLSQLQAGRKYRIVKFAYSWKLETFFRLHEFQKAPLVKAVKSINRIAKRQEISWARWVLKAYKWSRRPSPLRIGVSASWLVSRKIILAFLYGRLFDMSCKELTILYAQSDKQNPIHQNQEGAT
jgi:hypothetical protein